MLDFLRNLAIYICIPIYKCILGLYEIFYSLATAQFFTSDDIANISANIYVLVSVVMLFAFSATILSAIVNPDLMEDKKKGVGAIFKRAIIGLVLMVAIPFGFSEAFEIQKGLMDDHIIEKVIVGLNFNKASDANTGGNGGQIIVGTLMAATLYPSEDGVLVEAYVGDNVGKAYETMITTDFSEGAPLVAKYINSAPKSGNKEYAFEFEWLLTLIAGLATAYILLIFAIDMAVRMFKLAFFELTAPISIVAYIAAGGDILSKWFKEVRNTYFEVFIKITTMAFYLFLLHNLNTFIDAFKSVNGSGSSWVATVLLKVLLIIGMLIFAKQVPDLISRVFGLSTKSSGGISGRLASMAGVGTQAKAAWEAIRKHPIQSAGKPIGAVSGAIGNIAHSTGGAYRRTLRKPNGNKLKATGGAVSGLVRGIVSTPGALKRGWKTGNLSALGNEYARDRDLRPEGLSVKGQVMDSLTQKLGYGTKLDRMNDQIARKNRYEYVENGKTKYYTKDELSKISSQYDDVKKRTQTIQDIMKKEIERKDSLLKNSYSFQGVDLGKLNDHEIKATIASLRTAAPKMEDFKMDSGTFKFEYVDASGKKQYVELTGVDENNLNDKVALLQSYAPSEKDFEIKDASGNGTGQVDITKYNAAKKKYEEVIEKFKTTTMQSIRNNEVRYDQEKFIKSFKEYNDSVSELEDQVRKNFKESEEKLFKRLNTEDEKEIEEGWTVFNAKGDDSNKQEVELNIKVLDGLLENKDYAKNLGYNPEDLKNRVGIESLNTRATDNVNIISKTIEQVDADRNAQYTKDKYQQAARTDRHADNIKGKDHKVHKTDPGANDVYR